MRYLTGREGNLADRGARGAGDARGVQRRRRVGCADAHVALAPGTTDSAPHKQSKAKQSKRSLASICRTEVL